METILAATASNKTTPQNHADSWSISRSYCNGKEKDYESGFHYYGARYYWSELLTGWLSVDPMVDKYPSMSPYAYCAWNPVKLVDPDGREFDSISNIHVQRFEEFTKKQISSLEGKQQRTEEDNNKLTEY